MIFIACPSHVQPYNFTCAAQRQLIMEYKCLLSLENWRTIESNCNFFSILNIANLL